MSRFTQDPDYYTVEPFSDIPIIAGGLTRVRKLNVYYVDVNSSYLQDNKGIVVYDEDAIKRMIANIMATPLGSDHFEPTFGSNVPYRLMDPINEGTSFLLFNDTIGALLKWMSGIIVVNTATSYVRPINGDVDAEGYEIRLYYTVSKTDVVVEYNAFVLR